jgi:cell wall-associated NlpC family hydrolase
MRSGPATSYGIVATIPKGAVVEVYESSNGWDKVVYNGKTGWAAAQYLTAANAPAAPVAKVIKAAQFNLNMRSGAGTSYARILTIPAGGRVEVIGSSNGWDNVIYDGKTGWASSEFLTVVNEKATGADVIDFAKTLLGIPYTWAGNTPAEGFDCSGFTKYVYANFGVTISRLTSGQAVAGTAVAISDMQLGDIIYFGNTSITHVGLYVGNNQMIHAPSPGKFVEIRDLTWHLNNYTIVGARRVLN